MTVFLNMFGISIKYFHKQKIEKNGDALQLKWFYSVTTAG